MDAPSPERGPEILPRPRGIRAGKSAVRKRKAYQAYQLTLQPYRYRSAEEVPVIHLRQTGLCIVFLAGSRTGSQTRGKRNWRRLRLK